MPRTTTYRLVHEDAGHRIRVAVTAKNHDGSATRGLGADRHHRRGFKPQNTAAPTIAGTAKDGQTLTASPGTWTNTPTSFEYQWRRCDSNGAAARTSATTSRRSPRPRDVGSTIRVRVSAKNAIGADSALSAPTARRRTAGPARDEHRPAGIGGYRAGRPGPDGVARVVGECADELHVPLAALRRQREQLHEPDRHGPEPAARLRRRRSPGPRRGDGAEPVRAERAGAVRAVGRRRAGRAGGGDHAPGRAGVAPGPVGRSSAEARDLERPVRAVAAPLPLPRSSAGSGSPTRGATWSAARSSTRSPSRTAGSAPRRRTVTGTDGWATIQFIPTARCRSAVRQSSSSSAPGSRENSLLTGVSQPAGSSRSGSASRALSFGPRGDSSVGRASASQAEGREFEPRVPLRVSTGRCSGFSLATSTRSGSREAATVPLAISSGLLIALRRRVHRPSA